MIKLDIISDPICPWCYIGKTHLDRAIAENPDHPFQIEWHPFQLNPDMPKDGMDRREYLEHKFGGKEGAIRVYGQIADAAEAAGLSVDFAAIQRTPNTIDAHRLIHWAGLEGRQTPVVSFLFEAYFVEGRDIGDHQVLLEIAERAEMDVEVTKRLLESDADATDIAERDRHARARGVSGVPTHIIANQHVVSGAQQPDMWMQVIADINSQLEAQAQDDSPAQAQAQE